MMDLTDEKSLLVGLNRGSFSAFEHLYKKYNGKLYNFIMRLSSGNQYMAEEIVQATFIRIWEVREVVNPEFSFISFLCTIAKNQLMNLYQKQTVEFVYTEYLMKHTDDFDSQTEDAVYLHFLHEYIDSLADELPEQRRKIFLLSKRKNYTNKEIAQLLDISESTVSTQLALALKFIRSQLLKHYDTAFSMLLYTWISGGGC